MAKKAASKIIDGLKEALAFAQCDHAWGKAKRKGNTWTKVCKLCKVRVVKATLSGSVKTAVM